MQIVLITLSIPGTYDRGEVGPLAALLAGLLVLLAPAGAGAQNLPEVKILNGSNPTSVTEGQEVSRNRMLRSRGTRPAGSRVGSSRSCSARRPP